MPINTPSSVLSVRTASPVHIDVLQVCHFRDRLLLLVDAPVVVCDGNVVDMLRCQVCCVRVLDAPPDRLPIPGAADPTWCARDAVRQQRVELWDACGFDERSAPLPMAPYALCTNTTSPSTKLRAACRRPCVHEAAYGMRWLPSRLPGFWLLVGMGVLPDGGSCPGRVATRRGLSADGTPPTGWRTPVAEPRKYRLGFHVLFGGLTANCQSHTLTRV